MTKKKYYYSIIPPTQYTLYVYDPIFGVQCTGSGNYNSGTTVNISCPSSYTDSNSDTWQFYKWSNGDSSQSTSVQVLDNITMSPIYVLNFGQNTDLLKVRKVAGVQVNATLSYMKGVDGATNIPTVDYLQLTNAGSQIIDIYTQSIYSLYGFNNQISIDLSGQTYNQILIYDINDTVITPTISGDVYSFTWTYDKGNYPIIKIS